MDITYKPIHVIRCGNIKAACWLNHKESGSFYSTSIVRVYHDKLTDQWGQSPTFTEARDLLTAAYVAQEMCRWICQHKQSEASEDETDGEPPRPDAQSGQTGFVDVP